MGQPETSLDLPEVIETDGDSFDVLAVLGQGGMGVVYKARQHSLDRVVALKMLQPGGFADTAAVMRLRREATAAASIKHPNIVTVHSFGMYRGAPYIVMEYVEGQTLSERLQQCKKLPPSDVTAIFTQMLDALQAIHQAGLVHRDLKPANIIVTADGTAKLMDFGIAKQFTEGAAQRLTQTGAMLGTPAYMSPEQCASGKTDPRSDIYSLGCTMYHALSGREPFSADSAMEVMLKHMNEQATTAGIDPVLDNAIVKAMEKSPEDRFQTASEFKEAINTAQPGTHTRRRRTRSRKKRATLYIVASVVCALLLASFVVTSNRRPSATMEDPVPTTSTVDYSTPVFAENVKLRLNHLESELLYPPNRAKYKQEITDLNKRISNQLRITKAAHDYGMHCYLLDSRARAIGLLDVKRATELWAEVLDEADRAFANKPEQWDSYRERYNHALAFFARNKLRKNFDSVVSRAESIVRSHDTTSYSRHMGEAEIFGLRAMLEDSFDNHEKAAQYLRKRISEQEKWEAAYTPERAATYCALCRKLEGTQQWKEIAKIAAEQLPKMSAADVSGNGVEYIRGSIAQMQAAAALAWLRLGNVSKSDAYTEKSLQMRVLVGQPPESRSVAMMDHAMALCAAGHNQGAYEWSKRAYDQARNWFIENPAGWQYNVPYIRMAVLAGHGDQVKDVAQQLVPLARAHNEPPVIMSELEAVANGTVAGGTQK